MTADRTDIEIELFISTLDVYGNIYLKIQNGIQGDYVRAFKRNIGCLYTDTFHKINLNSLFAVLFFR